MRNLRRLLDQGEVWVTRGRWVRWLTRGDLADTVPIATMLPDERVAARAWLEQQRHVLHRTVGGTGERAADGWLRERPLYRALVD